MLNNITDQNQICKFYNAIETTNDTVSECFLVIACLFDPVVLLFCHVETRSVVPRYDHTKHKQIEARRRTDLIHYSKMARILEATTISRKQRNNVSNTASLAYCRNNAAIEIGRADR